MSIMIGLSGYGRAGKDSVGTFLATRGFKRFAFADKLRAFLYALNPVIGMARASLAPVHLQDVVDNEGWEVAKQLPEVTRLLQRCGTEAGRKVLWETIWIDATFNAITLLDYEVRMDDKIVNRYVFTDCRFENEAERIRANGGKIWRINRPGQDPKTAPDGSVHLSETALDKYPFDLTIENDGTLQDLRGKVNALVDLYYGK